MSPFYEKKDDKTWLWAVVGFVALGAFAGAWIMLSSPDENRLSGTRIFDQQGGAKPPAVPRAIERREDTGLSMVRVGGAAGEAAPTPQQLAGAGASAASAAPAETAAPAAGAPANPYAAASAAPPSPLSDKELAAAGVPVTPAGLKQLGAQKGLLSALAAKLLDHPKVLKAVLDNKLVVDAVMSRDISKRNCSDAGALASVMSDPGSPQMTKLMPLLQQSLSKPEAASAMLSSRLGQALMDCPSTKSFSSSPNLVMSVVMKNPQAMTLMTDPRVAQAMASNPQASGLFSGVSGALGKK